MIVYLVQIDEDASGVYLADLADLPALLLYHWGQQALVEGQVSDIRLSAHEMQETRWKAMRQCDLSLSHDKGNAEKGNAG